MGRSDTAGHCCDLSDLLYCLLHSWSLTPKGKQEGRDIGGVLQVGRLADALAVVKDVKEAELAGTAATSDAGGCPLPPYPLPTAEQGLNHLLLSTDVETLYRSLLLPICEFALLHHKPDLC